MNFFGIGLPEMAVIAAIGLLVFGPKRLPELGKTLGRTLRGFQSASQEFEKEFRSAIGSEGGAGAVPAPSLPASEAVAADSTGSSGPGPESADAVALAVEASPSGEVAAAAVSQGSAAAPAQAETP